MQNPGQKSCTFVLIRHGQTYWNKKKKMQGQVNIPLNDTGRQQARALAAQLEKYPFELCLSSPLIRASETAQTVIGSRKIPMVKHELLTEQGYGVCEGQWQRLVYRLPFCQMYHYESRPELYVPPIGAESMQDMLVRGQRVLDEVLAPVAENHSMVLVGAHGSIICAILNSINKVEIKDYWKCVLKNCGYAVIEYRDGMWTVLERH